MWPNMTKREQFTSQPRCTSVDTAKKAGDHAAMSPCSSLSSHCLFLQPTTIPNRTHFCGSARQRGDEMQKTGGALFHNRWFQKCICNPEVWMISERACGIFYPSLKTTLPDLGMFSPPQMGLWFLHSLQFIPLSSKNSTRVYLGGTCR